MFGLTFEKIIIIAVVAAFIIGPAKLPLYASKLAKLVQTLRGYTATARERVKQEMGPDFDDVDWKKLDPRQYDPRRIIRDALLDDTAFAPPASRPTASTPTASTPTTSTPTAASATPAAAAPQTAETTPSPTGSAPPVIGNDGSVVTNVKQINADSIQMKQAN